MSLTKVNADVLDLTDGYAFTGAVSGAGTVGGYEFVSKVTASISATAAFTNMVAGYDYLYIIKHVSPSTDGENLWSRFGITGPTYRTSTYLGYESSLNANTPQNQAVTNRASFYYAAQGYMDGEQLTGEMTVLDPVASTHTSFYSTSFYAGTGAAKNTGWGQGFYNADESHTAIQFLYSSGNIQSGDFIQYRRPNA